MAKIKLKLKFHMLNLYRGLLERANEMCYANHVNLLEREAACEAVQQRIAHPIAPIVAANVEGQDAMNGQNGLNVPPPNEENEDNENYARLDGLDPEEAAEQCYFEHGVHPAEAGDE